MSAKKNRQSTALISNSKARHKFTIGDKYEAGIQLRGTEVKSIRSGSAQISESFAKIVKDELFLLTLISLSMNLVEIKIMNRKDRVNSS